MCRSPPDGPWELCLTVNDSWGYRGGDTNHKSAAQIVRTFSETIAGGGNLLLDVGPKEDGTVPAEQAARLEELGDWIRRNREAVYGTVAGLPYGHFHGPSTLSPDRRTLYLHCLDAPRAFVAVRGLRNAVRRVSVLDTGEELGHRVVEVPGVLYVEPPARSGSAHHRAGRGAGR